MTKRRLTDAAIQRIKPPASGQTDHYDTAVPAFGLRISHMGTKSFFLMKRVDGKMGRVTLGRYPGLSLTEARERAGKVYRIAALGQDPRVVELERKQVADRQRRQTFHSLAERFIDTHVNVRLRPATRREYVRILLGPHTSAWADQLIKTITRSDVIVTMEQIASMTPGSAQTAFAYLRKFFNWCIEQEFLDSSPTDRVSLPYRTVKRERVLREDELPIVWRAFDDEPSVFGPMFKLLLLTGQRRAAGVAH